MAYHLSDAEKTVLRSLASGYTERETYLRLNIPESDFFAVWQRIREEFEGNIAETMEETSLREAYHRTEVRRLSAELLAAEARLAALMDTAPEAVLVIDGRSGSIVQVNNQSLLLFGYEKRELIGKKMELLITDDLKTIHVSYRQGFLNSARKREMGYHPPIHAVCKDGRMIQLDIALTATSATDDVMVVCKPVAHAIELQIAREDSAKG